MPPVPAEAEEHAGEALRRLREATSRLKRVLHQSTPNPKQQHLNRMAALEAQSAALEASLREDFDTWLTSANPAHGPPAREESAERLRGAVKAVVHATTPGSPLRREEAVRRARWELCKALQGPAPEPPPSATARKPRSRPRKGGRA